MSTEYIVESDVIMRAVDHPFHERQLLGIFSTEEAAYAFIQKYIMDTKDLHTYFARSYICPKNEYAERIRNGKMIAMNIVLGQFEDIIFVREATH
jgi:predicted adenine nucleotide alpha hydrolase (AANH) superfamily ATPase